MELSIASKKKILDLLKQHAIDNLYYSDYQEIIKQSRAKINNNDILNYLSEKATQEIEKNEELSTNKLSKIFFSIKLIISCGEAYHVPIDRDTVKIINQTVSKCKEKFLAQNIETSEILKQEVDELEEELTKHYLEILIEEENNLSEKNILSEELENTKKLIIDYENKIKELEKNQQKLEKELKKSKTTTENLKNAKNNLKITMASQKQEITNSKAKIKTLLKQTKENDLTISSLTELNHSLKAENEELNKKIELLNEKIKDIMKELVHYQVQDQHKINEQRISDIILSEFYTHRVSIEELIQTLSQNGYSINEQGIQNQLNKLKTNNINIIGPLFDTIPPVYGIDTNPLATPNPFYLKALSLKDELDILMISDLHKEFQIPMSEIDMVYNYASANNIHYIFNLGDNFDIRNSNDQLTIEDLKKLEQFIEEFANSFPKKPGMYLFNLGGNHDKSILNFGLDPLNRLQQYRSDFIDLGYLNTNIVFGNKKKKIILLPYIIQNIG